MKRSVLFLAFPTLTFSGFLKLEISPVFFRTEGSTELTEEISTGLNDRQALVNNWQEQRGRYCSRFDREFVWKYQESHVMEGS